MKPLLLAFVSALCSLIADAVAVAQPADEFYKGRQVRLVVGSETGNDQDAWARLLSRHLPRHIPGNPSVLVVNMPGAGSIVASNYLFNVAPRDGSAIGMVSRSMTYAAAVKTPNVQFDPTQFNWLGSPEVTHLVMFINNSAGVKRAADLFSRELTVGGTGLAQGLTVAPILLKNLLGMKLKVVPGYRSPGDLALAAGRGEIDAFFNTVGGPAGARRQWVESGQMRVLFNMEPQPVPWLDAPTIFEHATSVEQRAILALFASNQDLGRPVMAPPRVPQQRIAVLRRAFEEAMKDPALLKDAEKLGFEVKPHSGDRIAELVRGIMEAPQHIVEKAERASRP